MKKQQPVTNDDDAEARTEQLLLEYLRYTGKMIPQTAAEVAEADVRLVHQKLEAPQRLRDRAVLGRAVRSAPPRVLKLPTPAATTETAQYLARAAREGKEISQKVEEQMRIDREKSKREAQGEK